MKNIPQNYIAEFKRILASIAEGLPGYSAREPQKRMIAAISVVLGRAEVFDPKKDEEEGAAPKVNEGDTIICVEGGTGVGKSLGYLVGAFVPAKDKNRKLVIATATVALQEQLAKRDIPLFIQHADRKLSCALAKGRSRYVCHDRLRRLASDAIQDDFFGGEKVHSEEESKVFAELLVAYENKEWDGDRDELTEPVDDALWSHATTDSSGCLSIKCPSYRNCAQMRARDGVRSADIVVTNHDLLLADMSLGGGVILPSPEESFYIIDEAHHLPLKAANAFSAEHRVDGGRNQMSKLSHLAGQIGKAFSELRPLSIGLETNAEHLSHSLGEMYSVLNGIDEGAYSGNLWRFPDNKFPDSALALGTRILGYAENVTKEVAKLADKLDDVAAAQSTDVARKMLGDLGYFSGRATEIYDTWRMLLAEPKENAPPIARWVERSVKQNKFLEFTLKACPVAAGGLLRIHFFNKTDGVVLTSATLRTLGNFDMFLRDCGLSRLPKVSTIALPSPFDYPNQGVLFIPDLKVNPKDAAAHTRAIIEVLPDTIDASGNKGTLVLFASRKQMEAVYDGLPKKIRNFVLVQGDKSKSVLLREHYARIGAGKPSVLFGLQSFSEGLDLPGDACAHVVIAKIPFAVPSDPVQETLSEWLASRNRSYFDDIALPQACLKMIQAAGRLIRTETDQGILTILDGRISSTGFGKRILGSLPPFKKASSNEQFFQRTL